jgi:hypothetical protein
LAHAMDCVNSLADIIELGLPFTDPIADGPTIQKSNTVSISMADRCCIDLLTVCTASPHQWSHCHLGPPNGSRGTKEGIESSGLVYGRLPPDLELRRGEIVERL